MIYYGKKEHVDEYFADTEHQSQSMLKILLSSVEAYKALSEPAQQTRLHYEEKGYFIKGGGVDVYLTQGKEAFEEQYYTSNITKPSPLMMSIVQRVYDDAKQVNWEFTDTQLVDLESYIIKSIEAHAYQPKWTMPVKVAAVVRDGSAYFQTLVDSEGKQILSSEESDTVMANVMALKTHSYTKEYFPQVSEDGVDYYFQVPIYSTIFGVPVKGLLDLVIIDHNKKTIQLCDIKTIGDYTIKFKYAIKARRYDFQGAFYTGLMSNFKAGKATSFVLPKMDLSEYQILPFKFLVDSTTRPGNPLVFSMSEELLKLGKVGRHEMIVEGKDKNTRSYEADIKYEAVPGFVDGLEKFKWHEENTWEMEKEIYVSKGQLTI